ncbi:Tetratricopeptide domain protein [Gloeothece citriformis PCC 7424]|uniref:Tetratricopeptide domain protein n=1 Tax=Gloeothece citriformis (strain PCC 7424) TaxID=65393 RepID=B7KB11_GLOC7|nr:CHAT domain-containing protein [Gloeothece citriformis]ACK70121.1 Tetratricopeptide domain protein [Gloeothece citriformis PCC 7424]
MFRRLISLTILALVALLASLTFSFAGLSPTNAHNPVSDKIAQTPLNLPQQEQQGRELFQQGKIQEAIEVWQPVAETYRNQENWLNLASLLSNLALAYQEVGLLTQAEQAITESLSLLPPQPTSRESLQISGQVLNNLGLLQYSQGDVQQAFNTWEKGETVYKKLEDNLGILRSKLNQTLALQDLGLYPRACNLLIETLELSPLNCQNPKLIATDQGNKNLEILQQKLNTLPAQLDSIQILTWRRLARLLRVNGRLNEADLILKTIFPRLSSPEDKANFLLHLGKIEESKRQFVQALNYYQQALENPLNLKTKLKIQLAQLNLLILEQQWQSAASLVSVIEPEINVLPNTHTDFYTKLNFIYQLKLLKQAEKNYRLNLNIPAWEKIIFLTDQIVQNTKKLGDKQAESYGLGTLGSLYEKTQQWSTAQELTKQALLMAQSLNIPEITYRWQWQLARILKSQNQRENAINVYAQAINTLESIKSDLVSSSQELLFTFQEEVEPIYRELVDLLLQPNQTGIISQANLSQARDTIEALRLVELDNFFQQACLVTNEKKIDEIDPEASVIYTIILPDRLAIILSLPQQPLRYYSSSVKAEDLETVTAQFRDSLVIRSKRDFFPLGQQLYQWLIQPLEADLQASGIKTLVFVPDYALRNIPMSALYDRQNQQFLIEKNYNITVTSGLQILNPRPLKEIPLLTLAGGLTEPRVGFPPLNYVQQELELIENFVPTDILLNETFTVQALNQNIEKAPFPIVHLATHGQFSSEFEKTFILTWDEKLNIVQLERLLQQPTRIGQAAIELLVLSACETASGDKRAALGLAGMAVRSGARSTLATLWSVNDEGTAEFMKYFYEELATKTVNKAEAFKQAQLALLKNPRYRHPFYWSPYVLVGNWL